MIKTNNYTTVFEVGTAYGYSALGMYEANHNIKITTIEKQKDRYQIATKYLGNIKNINLVNDSILTYQIKGDYDLFFIDGCKSHQIDIVTNALSHLRPTGCILIDNINLGSISSITNPTTNQKKLLVKHQKFLSWLTTLKSQYKVYIDNTIGDGIAIISQQQINGIKQD